MSLADCQSARYSPRYSKAKSILNRIIPGNTPIYNIRKFIVASLWRSWPTLGEAILKFGLVNPLIFQHGLKLSSRFPLNWFVLSWRRFSPRRISAFQTQPEISSYIVEETLPGGQAGSRRTRSPYRSLSRRYIRSADPPDGQDRGKPTPPALERYYLTLGAHDPIIIDLPKGGYVPVFSTARHIVAAHPAAPPRLAVTSRRMMVAVLGLAVMAAAYRARLLALSRPVAHLRFYRQSEPHHSGSPLLGRHQRRP